MTERDAQIVKLTSHGMSAPKVKQKLGLDLSVEQIARIARRHVGKTILRPYRYEHRLTQQFKMLLDALPEDAFGKDKYTCEICGDSVPHGCDLHHTKYEGATIFDLEYVCRSCNLARVNKGLD